MAGTSVYQIKVTLKDMRPPVWRRCQVPADVNLDSLHMVLQVVMGWTNSHLYQFKARGAYYGEPHPDYAFDDLEMKDASRTKLSELVDKEKTKFVYEYDFGDSWEHEILIEKVLTAEPGVRYPVCLTGKRACPPEDCGGVWGYSELLSTIQYPEDPEYDEMMDWLGEGFDPEQFDVDEINQMLRAMERE